MIKRYVVFAEVEVVVTALSEEDAIDKAEGQLWMGKPDITDVQISNAEELDDE